MPSYKCDKFSFEWDGSEKGDEGAKFLHNWSIEAKAGYAFLVIYRVDEDDDEIVICTGGDAYAALSDGIDKGNYRIKRCVTA